MHVGHPYLCNGCIRACNIDAENPLPLVPGHDLYIMNVALSAEASSLGRTSLILSLMTESTPVLMTIGSLILGHVSFITFSEVGLTDIDS